MIQAVVESGAYDGPQIGFRLKLDGRGSAAEFAELLEHLQFLNDVARLKHDEARESQGGRYFHILPWMDRYTTYHRRFGDPVKLKKQKRLHRCDSTPAELRPA